ncbi:MAG: hydroxyethylthiazole kinase [Eubacteriales bacterium]|nr:hydroxyethylthiazole kinase [Eubacteriales bacterium]
MKVFDLSEEIFENIRKTAPVVHNISNYITATDCANMTLACGGSPTMADDPEEVAQVASACHASVINMGNTAGYFEESMLRTGRANNEVGHPLVWDPVGAGGSSRRNAVVENLMNHLHFSIIRGNISEIKFVGDKSSSAKGVDADASDLASESNIQEIASYAKTLSKRLDTIIAISGPIDVVADADTAYLIRNGHPMMSRITGTGCMLSSAIGVFAAANPDHLLEATAVAVSAYGYAGELAYQKMLKTEGGTGSLRTFLIDYMSNMDPNTFLKGANITIAEESKVTD